jgi:hypothetical protein
MFVEPVAVGVYYIEESNRVEEYIEIVQFLVNDTTLEFGTEYYMYIRNAVGIILECITFPL